MKSALIAVIIDRGISIFAAVAALLFGYRILGKRPGESPQFDDWHGKWGKTLLICGWVMLAIFIPLLISDIVRLIGR